MMCAIPPKADFNQGSGNQSTNISAPTDSFFQRVPAPAQRVPLRVTASVHAGAVS
jgi:hypothetical protein